MKYNFCDEINQWMGEARGTYVGEGICRQSFGGEKDGKTLLARP
jgi:hypothetical protein